MARVFVLAAGAAISALVAQCQTPVRQPSVGVFLDFDSVPGKMSRRGHEEGSRCASEALGRFARLAPRGRKPRGRVLRRPGGPEVQGEVQSGVLDMPNPFHGQTTALGTTAGLQWPRPALQRSEVRRGEAGALLSSSRCQSGRAAKSVRSARWAASSRTRSITSWRAPAPTPRAASPKPPSRCRIWSRFRECPFGPRTAKLIRKALTLK